MAHKRINKKWETWQLDFLKKHYGTLPNETIVKVTGHTLNSVRTTANALGANYWHKFTAAKIPTQPTPEVAYIQGVLCGDGHLSTRLVLGDCDLEFVQEFQNNIEKAFAVSYPIRIYQHHVQFYGGKKWSGTRYEVSIRQQAILQYFNSIGTYMTHDWVIPEYILKGGLLLKANFIRGLFDSEATVHLSKKGNLMFPSIEMFVVNQEAEKIKPLLNEFGIKAATHKRKDGCYGVVISNLVSLIKYMQQIGFSSSKKRNKITPYLRLPRTGPYQQEARELALEAWWKRMATPEAKP